MLIEPNNQKRHKISIIPHYVDYGYINDKYGDVFNVINLNTLDIKNVVDEIASSECILSSSLHGIITAHAYNVPALWFQEIILGGDGFKFADYFASVEIEDYVGLKDYESTLLSKDADEIIEYLNNNYSKSLLPNRAVVSKLQRDLLKCAPFPLLPEFKKYVEESV